MPPRGAKGGRGGGRGGAAAGGAGGGGEVREVDKQLVEACEAGDVAGVGPLPLARCWT